MEGMTLGEQLGVIRARRGYSIAALARLCGMSINTVQDILKTKETVSLGNYKRLAKALDVSIKFTVEGK